MRLPAPTPGYSARDQAETRGIIERADAGTHKRGADIEVAPGRLILTSPNGTRYSITVSNAGALTATAI